MLIPSIDLMGGKIVQLVQGEKKALEFDDFDEWIAKFSGYPVTQLIDLDAAMNQGSNAELVHQFCGRLTCQVGGGVRNIERAQELLSLGATRVIIGSSLFRGSEADLKFARELADVVGTGQLVFAVDSKGGKVAVAGWKEVTNLATMDAMRVLDPFCDAFLYTHVDTEGTMTGFPLEIVPQLLEATTKRLIVAGGIRSSIEIDKIDSLGVDCVVGMAIYTGTLQI